MGKLQSQTKTFAGIATTIEKNKKGGLIATAATAVVAIGTIVKATIDAVTGAGDK